MSVGTVQRRRVDNWYLGPMLGKGGYSWVKTGYNIKTNKPVALKFMNKAEGNWAKEQAEQVSTEIEALKKISHTNVMKLYAYNLTAKYPEKDGTIIDTILLVLEMAPGGELFDILYYTQNLKEDIARTYFQQLLFGLEAIHKKNITHRDLKPQNLLLDKHFRLKITDFGLSNIFEDDSEKHLMKTTYVGTKGYQAPELLLNRKYTNACDLFSCGVILFIMLTGYPPFEEARAADSWYKCIAQKKHTKFWKKHSGVNISDDAKTLIEGLICYQPSDRFTIKNVQESSWFKKKGLEQKELKQQLTKLHREALAKKKKDKAKQAQLNVSAIRERAIEQLPGNGTAMKIPNAPTDFEPNFNTFYIDISDEKEKSDEKENKSKNKKSEPKQSNNPATLLSLLDTYIKNKEGKCTWNKEGCEIIGELLLSTNELLVIKANEYMYNDRPIVVFKRHQGSHPAFSAFFDTVFTVVQDLINIEEMVEEKKEEKKKSDK